MICNEGYLRGVNPGRIGNRWLLNLTWAANSQPGFGIYLHMDREAPLHISLTLWRVTVFLQFGGHGW